MDNTRPDWDTYFGKIALLTSERSTCIKRKVGAVFVGKGNRILSTGYNGSLPGELHCIEVGCDIVNNKCCRTVHAEMNGLLGALKSGARFDQVTAYVTAYPCWVCFKACVTAGVKRFRYIDKSSPDPRVDAFIASREGEFEIQQIVVPV
jgi:dCMP deaminase